MERVRGSRTPVLNSGSTIELYPRVLLLMFENPPKRCLFVHENLAEGRGFEPRKPVARFSGVADRRIKPLCHPSMFELATTGGVEPPT